MKKLSFLLIIFGLFSAHSMGQGVSPFQGGAYQAGLLNIRDLSYFAPDLYFYDYNYWNSSSSYYNHFGNQVSGLEIDMTPIDPELGMTTLDLAPQESGYTNMPSIYYVSKIKLFGGKYIASISPVFITSNSKMHVYTSDTSVYTSGNGGGFGDLELMPFGVSWTFNEKVDLAFMFSIYAPTGRYKTGADDNIGKGYWVFQFQVPTYLYFFEQAMALVVVPTFEVNGKVLDADVRPGGRFTIEYGISQNITPWLEVEILNGHNWQVTDDKGEDVWWKESELFTKDQSSTVSFGVGFWPWQGRLNARLQYAQDYGVKQGYKSSFLTVSLLFYANLLTEK